MKKTTKFLFMTLIAFNAVNIINDIIFSNAEKTKRNSFKQHIYNSKYGQINYITKGEGNPLLLIHGIGIGASHAEWKNNIDFLSKKYKVYTVDLLGFGNSDKPKISYSSYLYVQLINEFINNVIKQPVNVIASSNSASIVITAYAFNKSLYKKLLLISPTGMNSKGKQASNNDFWLKLLLESPIIGTSIYNVMSSKFFIKKFLKENIYDYYSLITNKDIKKYNYFSHINGIGNKYVISAFISKYLNINIKTQIQDIDIPIHIIWGENNKLNPVKNVNKISELNKNISFTIFEKTMLFPHIENEKEFNKICSKFF